MLIVFIGLRNRPELPPSKAAENQQKSTEKYS
jgi:hypothetical protein